MSLVDLFNRAARRMELELEDVRDAFGHSGVKGAALEAAVVEKFLLPFLPGRIGVCTGQVIVALGARSKQLDVVLFDRENTPTFKLSGDTRLIPAECVFAVIEVKTSISSKGDVQAIFENMESVRGLSRDAITPDPRLRFVELNVHGKPARHFPIHYSCFAFECGSQEVVRGWLEEETSARSLSHDRCVDSVLALRPTFLLEVATTTPVSFEAGQYGRGVVEYFLGLHGHLSKVMMSGFLDLGKYLSAS